ncbi:type VII secretion protein EccE [Mycolicibacterium holsaticum]|uniref:Type VII secretion protein EccE n=1 Tax=Mycolicibacterium holsaticum TaxID=152142 RepID=A0A1E3S022_9MYCO|nr:type VII secretion protein EccE [Mycolicibacterium holsaticum]ODQ95459.1 type VII secretion protein EccE [Mycolicibacterium holsaticum]
MTVLDDQIPGPTAGFTDVMRRWRLDLRLKLVVVAELIAATILAIASPVPWWVVPVVLLAVLLAATVSYNGATAAGWLVRAIRFGYFRRFEGARRDRARIPETFTVDMPGAGPIGMIWDGQYAVTMIALHGRPFSPTVLVPAGAETVDTIPLQAIESRLRQFAGLELHSVDVVQVGSRVAGDGGYTPKYAEIVGDRAAVGDRRTWLVLRLCPQACLAAMLYRGDAAAAAAAATERVRQAVLRSGCRAVTSTEPQLRATIEALLNNTDLDRVQENWSNLDADADYVTTYRIAGRDLNTKLINDLWTVRAHRTVTTVRLFGDATGRTRVAGLVRFHTDIPMPNPPLLALQPVSGQAFDSLLASLPLGDRALRLEMSPRPLGDGADLKIPVGPSGPLFGMTVTGVPFLMPLTDPLRATRVSLSADLSVAIPLLLRTSAAGAVILIHTDRPAVWQPLCDNDYRISLASDRDPVRPPTVIVADGEGLALTAGERGHSLVTLGPVDPDADVTIVQESPDELVVGTPAVRGVRLSVMRPRNEAQFLTHLHAGVMQP